MTFNKLHKCHSLPDTSGISILPRQCDWVFCRFCYYLNFFSEAVRRSLASLIKNTLICCHNKKRQKLGQHSLTEALCYTTLGPNANVTLSSSSGISLFCIFCVAWLTGQLIQPRGNRLVPTEVFPSYTCNRWKRDSDIWLHLIWGDAIQFHPLQRSESALRKNQP